MKQKTWYIILTAEAVLCALYFILSVQDLLPGIFPSLLAAPFSQLGAGLRALSLSGGAQNALAIVLYAALSLAPVFALILLKRKRPLHIEDALLGLTSALLFAVLYLAVNPGYLSTGFAEDLGLAHGGGVIWSTLCAWIVLRLLRILFSADTGKLQRYLNVLLNFLNVYFVYAAVSNAVGSTLLSIHSVQSANLGNEHLLGPTYVFLAAQGVINALPDLLNILIVFSAKHLLLQLQSNRYAAETVAAAELLSSRCRLTLTVTVLTITGFNLLQFLFADSLHVIREAVYIPLFSISFSLAALLLARFIQENKQLKDDNDLFI